MVEYVHLRFSRLLNSDDSDDSVTFYGQFAIQACFLDYQIDHWLDSYDEMKID